MFGNGLKAQIWKPFVEKFGIKEIFEFYGATESNSNLSKLEFIFHDYKQHFFAYEVPCC